MVLSMLDEERQTVDAIALSILSARAIFRRERVKATNRFERVGIFVTCLRRDLRDSWLRENLSNKGVWFDVGELSTHFVGAIGFVNCPLDIRPKKIQEWVMYAVMQADAKKDDPIIEIELKLDMLQESLGYFSMQQRKADVLLKGANKLADELADTLTI